MLVAAEKNHFCHWEQVATVQSVIKPIRTDSIELQMFSNKSNVNIIQKLQSKTLGLMTGARVFISNNTLNVNFNIPSVGNEFRKNNKNILNCSKTILMS